MDADFPAGMVEELAKFLEGHRAYEGCHDLYPVVFKSNLFFPLQRQEELAEMIRTAKAVQPRVVMEIGADKGGGLYHWCKCLPSVKSVIACEIRGLPYSHLFDKYFPRIQFHWMHGPSRDTVLLNNLKQWLHGEKIDVLFIDGDKATMMQDFYSYLPLMSRTGIVFIHDITDPAPSAQYYDIVKCGWQHREIVDKSDWIESNTRERNGHPPRCPHEAWLREWRGRSCGVGVIYLGGKLL